MSTSIIPMAMKPRINTPFKLYFLAFPSEWKALILRMHLTVDPKFNTNYNIKTTSLYNYLNGWLEHIVQLHPMQQDSDDKDWMVSMYEPDIKKICEILQIWIVAEYLDHSKKTDETEKIAEELLAQIHPDALKSGLHTEEKLLFDADGHALTDYAFNAFSLYAANALCGKTVTVDGQELHLYGCGSKKLISQPISDKKEKPHYYAIGLELSVQTTPPERACMLLIRCSTKRFVSETWSDSIYLSEDIHAYVSTGAKKYRCMTLKMHPHVWDKAEQNCYHLYHVHSLPDANEVLAHPEAYLSEQAEPQILLPYKFGMNFANMRIGTGFSIKNKKELFEQIGVLMCDFAEPVEYANPISQAKTVHMNDKNEPAFHRERLKSCTGMTGLHIEIYGHASDKALQNRIIADIETYLGTEEKSFPILVTCKELGALGDMMPDSTYQSHCERIQQVCQSISKAETITGAIVILPNTSGQEGDPKYALRAGFADSNRLTQFITPDLSAENEETPSESRIHGAVMDLLRQFGYTEFSEKRQMLHNPAFEADTIGMYIMHQLKPLWAKTSRDIARFLPVYVTYQVRTGQLFVDCDLLKKRHMSYPEALLTLSVLSRNTDFVQKCKEAAYGGFRTKLLGLQSLYRNKPVMLLVQANGITRPLWNGLTDKQIGEYQFQAPFIPEKIAIGSKNYSDQKSFLDTEIRILRIRENLSTHEVPEYYTELNKDGNCIASSGIYRFRNIFWGLESRPKNKEYLQSYKKSRFTSTTLSFDECGLVEYYPLQLQQEDDAEQWVACANYLREVMPETSRSVRLPAPLHFASLMEEYLLLAPPKK